MTYIITIISSSCNPQIYELSSPVHVSPPSSPALGHLIQSTLLLDLDVKQVHPNEDHPGLVGVGHGFTPSHRAGGKLC